MKKKILIVDDVALNRHLLKQYIDSDQYTIIYAENGLQAIEKIENKKPCFLISRCQ